MDTSELNDLLHGLPDVTTMLAEIEGWVLEAAPEDMALIGHLLPPGFGQPRVMLTPTPAESSLTALTQKISIRVSRSVMTFLREEAHRRGVGYQTFMNTILNAAATGQSF